MFGDTGVEYLQASWQDMSTDDKVKLGKKIVEFARGMDIFGKKSSGSNNNMSYDEMVQKFCDLKKIGQTDQIDLFLFQLRTSGQQSLANKLEEDLKNCFLKVSPLPTVVPTLPTSPTSPTVNNFTIDDSESSDFQDKLIKFGIPIVGVTMFYFLFMKKKKKR